MSYFDRPPPDPQGGSQEAIWLRQLMKWIRKNYLKSVKGLKIIPDPSGNGFHLEVIPPKKVQPGGSGDFQWQNPKELDPTKSVSKDTFVYISPANPIVTTGLMDLTTGTLIQAMPGIWQALQTVPAQVTVGGVTKYNVPSQIPTGAVAGSPSKGDADNPAAFWIPWAGIMQCG